MEKSFNNVEDFLTDESFRSWVNNPTPELDERWFNWLKENETKRPILEESKEMIQNLKFNEFQTDNETKKRILHQINTASKPKSKQVVFSNYWIKVAAMLVLISGIAITLYLNKDGLKPKLDQVELAEVVTKSNGAGTKSQHMLPDGSKVYLNSGSSIEYPKNFEANVRAVTLKGEAFFDVAKDVNRPFHVLTDDVEVIVLGTEFNVNTRLEHSTVALVEGSVQLESNLTDASLVLMPGEMAVLSDLKDAFKTTSFDADYITGWKEGRLYFRDDSFEEVIDKLHAWYGIEIVVEDQKQFADWSYTGSFKNQSLEKVLMNMSTLRSFDYQIKNDSLIFILPLMSRFSSTKTLLK